MSTLLLNRDKHIGEEFFVFGKFTFPSVLLLTHALPPGAEPDIFIWGGPLEGPVLQQGELSMVCVGLSERDLLRL